MLEHLGLGVNRLIRISYGPFQLGDLTGEVEEVRGRVLRDQLGEKLAAAAGADFDAPLREREPEPKPAPKKPRVRETPRRNEIRMRVVGGRFRGRPLAAPRSHDIRPTSDRLRKSLFNILIHGYDLPREGTRVLDLFAGTGALGIEAIRAARRLRCSSRPASKAAASSAGTWRRSA